MQTRKQRLPRHLLLLIALGAHAPAVAEHATQTEFSAAPGPSQYHFFPGAVFSGSGNLEQSVFVGLSGPLPFYYTRTPNNTPAKPTRDEFRLLLESRHESTGTESGDKRRRHHGRLSLATRAGPLRLHLGSRYIPGPRTRFLAHNAFYSALPGLPSARERESIFVQSSDYSVPGLFYLRGAKQPGIFFVDREEETLFALDPHSRLGVFAFDFPLRPLGTLLRRPLAAMGETNSGRLRGDLLYTQGEYEGYLSLLEHIGDPFQGDVVLGLEAERDHKDDHDEEKNVRRPGKTGMFSTFFDSGNLQMEAAGRDLAGRGLRVAGLGIAPELHRGEQTALRLLLRARAYRVLRFGARPSNETPRDQERFDDAGAGAGLDLRSRHGGLRLLAEARRRGPASGELALWLRAGVFEFDLGAAFRRPLSEKQKQAGVDAPLFLRTRGEAETGARFVFDSPQNAVFRVRASFLYLYLVAGSVAGRPTTYMNLQFRVEL